MKPAPLQQGNQSGLGPLVCVPALELSYTFEVRASSLAVGPLSRARPGWALGLFWFLGLRVGP